MKKFFFSLVGAFSFVFSLIMFAAQISPDQAGSGLAKWVKFIRILHVPSKFQVDKISLAFAVISLILMLFIFRKKRINFKKEVSHTQQKTKYSYSNKQTIELVPDTDYRAVWHMGSKGGKSIRTFSAEFYVTNKADIPVIVAGMITSLDKDLLVLAEVSVRNDSMHYDKDVTILPGHTTKLHVILAVWPTDKNMEDCIEISIAIIDQFNNKHWVNIEFESIQNVTIE